ncbi:hypothetical protein NQ318_019104 [Aromia moschata]|uniref:Uncharacterized protein n=1 Tax=Aromia moschata TaxID=1265417 RepID=A0AAV8XPU2_9CUCU|nr:hypothetical protein NQ318_019104 [Aromia moschata]
MEHNERLPFLDALVIRNSENKPEVPVPTPGFNTYFSDLQKLHQNYYIQFDSIHEYIDLVEKECKTVTLAQWVKRQRSIPKESSNKAKLRLQYIRSQPLDASGTLISLKLHLSIYRFPRYACGACASCQSCHVTTYALYASQFAPSLMGISVILSPRGSRLRRWGSSPDAPMRCCQMVHKTLKEENVNLKSKLSEISQSENLHVDSVVNSKLDGLEQRNKMYQLRIFGVQETKDENLKEVLLDFFDEKMAISNCQIEYCYRIAVNNKRDKKPRPILVKFANMIDRNMRFIKVLKIAVYHINDLLVAVKSSEGTGGSHWVLDLANRITVDQFLLRHCNRVLYRTIDIEVDGSHEEVGTKRVSLCLNSVSTISSGRGAAKRNEVSDYGSPRRRLLVRMNVVRDGVDVRPLPVGMHEDATRY